MAITETSMGGGAESFPATAGFSVLGDSRVTPEERRAALNRLCSMYWRPVYAYIRVTRRAAIEEAKDLAQAFFVHVLDQDLASRYDPAKGRFRHFLKGSLKHFLANVRRDAAAEKRGGGTAPFSLDTGELDTEEFLADARREDPERLFDRQWAEDIVGHGVLRLRDALKAEGREIHYLVYEAVDLCPPDRERPSYEEVGRRLGTSADQVRNHLHAARTRLKELVLRLVQEYSSTPEELKEEVRDLFPG